jgi:hypothetical protein
VMFSDKIADITRFDFIRSVLVQGRTPCRSRLYEMATDGYQPHTGHKKYDDLPPRETRELADSGEKSENLRQYKGFKLLKQQ